MANATYGRIMYAHAAGILSKTPIHIRAIQFYPAAVSDVIDLNFWDESNAVSDSEVTFNASIASGVLTETSTSLHTITEARFPATDVVKILDNSSCLAANKTYHLIGSAGENHTFTVDPVTTLTDELTKDYHTITYPSRPFFNALQPTVTSTFESKFHYFGGIWVPNLILETISSNAYALIYID